MTKSYVRDLLEVYSAIFKDAKYAYPNLVSDLSKDEIRLTRLTTSRGLPFLMVDLPALGKHLDRCMAEGQYKLSGKPGSRRVSGRVVIPKLFRGLYLLIFNEDGRVKEHIDEQAYFMLRQLLYGAKKASYQCSDEDTRREVVEFLETDRLLPQPSPWWTSTDVEENQDPPFPGFAQEAWYLSKPKATSQGDATSTSETAQADEKLLTMLDKVVGLVSTTLGPYRFEEWRFAHGPGEVSNLKPFANRFRFVNWSQRLESAFPVADCAFHDWMSWGTRCRGQGYKMGSLSPVSKLTAVPKSLRKPRLIASEPQEGMWCQQNIRRYFYDRCENSWLSKFVRFKDQRRNQELARRGSLDGSLVTIDLSAASDRVSCTCVGNTFRSNRGLLWALRASRTHVVDVSSFPVGETTVPLRKYSTMGNATTFPVETLIFMSIAIAATLVARGRKPTLSEIERLEGQVSVFGDDIIAPKESVGNLLRLLEVTDFKVNVNKSYLNGLFRESCGVDCYAGVDVTPAYWHGPTEETPESVASALAVSNNFYQKFLLRAAEHIRSTLPAKFSNWPVTSMDSGVAGLRSFCRPFGVPPTYKVRWNQDLQRTEYFVLAFQTQQLKDEISDETALLQFFTECPHPSTTWKAGVATRPVLKIRRRWVPDSDRCHRGAVFRESQLYAAKWGLGRLLDPKS